MQNSVINVEKIKIFTIFLLCVLKIHSVLSACSEDKWSCDDESCIPLQKKCDGIVDCADRSDETAENCIHLYRACQDFAFTCTYGACITSSHRCNGIRDCSDNSDELVCSKSRAADLQGTCGPEELQCLKSKECVNLDTICDGMRDCSDSSDESVEVCAEFKCPERGFHCGYGGCINEEARCNGTIECIDGSDEAWELCGTPRKIIAKPKGPMPTKTPPRKTGPSPATRYGCETPPDIKYFSVKLHPSNITIPPGSWLKDADTIYVECNNRAAIPDSATLLCDNGKWANSKFPTCSSIGTTHTKATPATTVEEAGCQIPLDIEGVSIKLHPLNTTIEPGEWLVDTETIHVECTNRADISTSASLLCDNGKFKSQFPSCSNYCDGNLLKGLSTIYHCFQDGHYIESRRCNTKILPNIEVRVLCAPGYKRTKGEQTQIIRCLPNGKFDVEREKCDPECGLVQPLVPLTLGGIHVNPNDVPWHVAIYELDNGQYAFICGGSVISPRLIISAAHCFWDNARKLQRPVENYQFVAGKYTRQYTVTKDEMPQSGPAVSIHISRTFHGIQDRGDIALVKLKEPLVYNENISAVCMVLGDGYGSDYVPSGTMGFVTGYGQKNTLEQVPMKSRDFYSCADDPEGAGLTNDKFCLTNEYSMNICRGDSGGGFIVKNRDGLYHIFAVISYTPSTQLDCARDGFVGVTNVRYILPDLKEIISSEIQNDIKAIF